MSPRRIAAGRARLVRAIVSLTGVSVCLGAVAYAANRPEGRDAGLGGSQPVSVAPQQGTTVAPKAEQRLPQAEFIEYPESTSTMAEPQFRFHVPSRSQAQRPAPAGQPGQPAPPRRFQCKLDGEDWSSCSSPHRLRGLAPDEHRLAVRAFSRAGRPGPAASYSWQQVEEEVEVAEQEQVDPQPFSIELRDELEALVPGDPAQSLQVTIVNPNTVPIEVIDLTASIAGEPPDCPAENFELTASSASPTAPLTVPAGGAVALPTAAVAAPTIAMLNLPQNQDACKGVAVHLDFRGEARG